MPLQGLPPQRGVKDLSLITTCKVLVYPSDSFLISNVIIVTTFNLLISGEKIVHYTSNM